MANEPQDVTIPTKEELKQLPRWARLAFAARCARRVQPLFALRWTGAPKEHVAAVDAAITLAEAASRDGAGSTGDFVATAARAVYAARAADAVDVYAARATAYAAAHAAYAFYAADGPDQAASAADHAAKATHAETSTGYAAATGPANAAHAANVRAMRTDYEMLAALKKARRWKDTTKVDPDLLGPLWPEGTEPEWAKAGKQKDRHEEVVQEQEIKRLPHFARVAFAARCARRVQPLFTALWKDAPRKHIEAVEEMIALAEVAARDGVVSTKPVNHFAFAHADTVVAVHGAANAATHAAYAAQSIAQSASYAAMTVVDAANADTSTIAAMRVDYGRLLALTREKRWTDASPVDNALLGALWPQGMEPEWATASQGALSIPLTPLREPGKLVLKFTVPAIPNTQQSRAALVAQLKESILAANALHIAHGGSGLKIDDVKAWAAVGSATPASGGGQ